jgi:endonuclease G
MSTTLKNYYGYQPNFLGDTLVVTLPKLTANQQGDLAPVAGTTDNVAHYVNYSAVVSKSRKFPYFTASNIDGTLFKKVNRKDNWRKDPRIDEASQWGPELYKAKHSDFDRGHMTKREDVQWGVTVLDATNAADSTFYYTNAVPQHAKLNQRIWADLEDYILHTEAVRDDLRICVFTGPVLSDQDPLFVTPVQNVHLKIPFLFWKVVVFPKSDGKLYRTGFIMGQKSLLEQNKIVETTPEVPEEFEVQTDESKLFMEFKEADTFQVSIATIEQLTGLTLPKAADSYTDPRPIKLVVEEVDLSLEGFELDPAVQELGFRIPNLVL